MVICVGKGTFSDARIRKEQISLHIRTVLSGPESLETQWILLNISTNTEGPDETANAQAVLMRRLI